MSTTTHVSHISHVPARLADQAKAWLSSPVSRVVSHVPPCFVSKSVSRCASDRGHQGTVYRPSQVRSIGRVNGLMVFKSIRGS
jgi:hypothetical protein